MLLNVLSRRGDGCRAMQRLIRDCHEPEAAKKAHRARAWQLFRALVDRQVVEFIPRTEEGATLQVNVELQDDFSMDQALSLYLLETIPLLDADSPEYALDLVTLVESILENPEIILRRQLDKIKDRAVAQMKADGVEYEQRMEELEKLEYPKPLRDFVYTTFNAFADKHPWVGRGEHPAEVDRARDVRAVPVLRRVHLRLRAPALRGPAAAPPQQRLQGAEPDRARRREERRGDRDGAVPPDAAEPGRLEPGRRMGADARPGLPARGAAAAAGRRPCGRRGRRPRRRHHPRQEALHGRHPRPRVHVPARLVARRPARRAGRARSAARAAPGTACGRRTT